MSIIMATLCCHCLIIIALLPMWFKPLLKCNPARVLYKCVTIQPYPTLMSHDLVLCNSFM